jgi:hypothetical protein
MYQGYNIHFFREAHCTERLFQVLKQIPVLSVRHPAFLKILQEYILYRFVEAGIIFVSPYHRVKKTSLRFRVISRPVDWDLKIPIILRCISL